MTLHQRMRRTRLAATLTVAAVALLGCSSGGDSDDVTSAPTAASSPYVIANGSVPKRPLIPSNTYEAGGVRIVSNVFAGLVYYDADGRPQQEMATSISTPDNLTWTVILEPGWTFSDGSPVTPTSYVKAWDWAATASNGQINAYYFEPIIGFSYTEDSSLIAAGGLEAREDENIIKIHLSQPIADFPARLGYHAFYPLPEAAYADMASYGAHPIGNGPYLIGDATADGTDGTDGADRADEAGTDETDSAANATASADNTILLTPNPDYTGPRKAANKGIEIVAYDNLDDAYTDLRSGRLDILDTLPAEAINTFAQDLGSRAINQPTATFQGLTIPSDIDHFGDNDEGWLRRRAISHAIDRKAIASTVLADTVTPAHDFTSSMLPGWTDTIAGVEALDHDVAQAKDLWTQADAIDPYTGAFTITYNADGGHGPWIDAICEQITETLGINAHGIPIASYDSFRAQVTDHLVGGAFRMRWQADYPSLYNFLGPLYESYGAGNDGGFTAPEVDQLLAQAMSATNIDDSNAAMIAVQQELLKRLPVIPLWYSNVTGGVSSSVNNVVFGWNSVPLYYSVVKN